MICSNCCLSLLRRSPKSECRVFGLRSWLTVRPTRRSCQFSSGCYESTSEKFRFKRNSRTCVVSRILRASCSIASPRVSNCILAICSSYTGMRESIAKCVREIRESLEKCAIDALPVVCVVPVRMQEAWLLIDEFALRKAAGNPRGRRPLNIPDPNKLEYLPDPKQILHELLHREQPQRPSLKRFIRDVGSHVHRVAEHIDDFSLLCELTAFQQVEHQVVDPAKQSARVRQIWLDPDTRLHPRRTIPSGDFRRRAPPHQLAPGRSAMYESSPGRRCAARRAVPARGASSGTGRTLRCTRASG